MKIDIEKIETAMKENGIDDVVIAAVITQLKSEIEEEDIQPEVDDTPTNEDLTDNSENLPKVKFEYVIVLNDKDGHLKDKEIAGWVVQQEENADAGLIVSKISKAVKDQNAGAKKKTNKIDDMISAFEYLKPKWLKEKNVKIKTKDLTRVIISNGKLY